MRTRVTLAGRRLDYVEHRVRTPDDVILSVQDHDRGGGGRDVLFIHGFSQSGLSWLNQTGGPLAARYRLVTWDLRGHGASDKPLDPDFYRDPARWAGEVDAVIDATGLRQPIVVSWSWGGRVALDYLSCRGAGAIGGLVKVASTAAGLPSLLGPATPLLRAMAGANGLAENYAATAALIDACVARPLPPAERELIVAFNMMVPPAVRVAMGGRPADYDDVLDRLDKPMMAIHGARDPINLVAMSDHAVALTGGRRLVYEEAAHMPFWEEPDRFDADLAAFIDAIDS